MLMKRVWMLAPLFLGLLLTTASVSTPTSAEVTNTVPQLSGFAVVGTVDHVSQSMTIDLSGGYAGTIAAVQFNVSHQVSGAIVRSEVFHLVTLDSVGNATFTWPLTALGIAGDFAAQVTAYCTPDETIANLKSTSNSYLVTSMGVGNVTDIYNTLPGAYQQLYDIVESQLTNGASGTSMPMMPPVTGAPLGDTSAFASDSSSNPLTGWGSGRWFRAAPFGAPPAPVAQALLSSGPAGVFGTN